MNRVNAVTRDVFSALTQIRHIDESMPPDPEMLHGRLRSFVDRMMRRAQELGFNQQDVQDMAYAVVALADELVLTASESLRDFWLPRLLQLHYFNETVAGENFFVKLQQLRNDPGRIEVLEVYYLCLLFGFQGQYRVRGGEVELANIIEGLQEELARAGALRDKPLAPHGEPPKEARGNVARSLPVVLIAVAMVVVSIIVYAGMRMGLDSRAEEVSDRIEEMAGS